MRVRTRRKFVRAIVSINAEPDRHICRHPCCGNGSTPWHLFQCLCKHANFPFALCLALWPRFRSAAHMQETPGSMEHSVSPVLNLGNRHYMTAWMNPAIKSSLDTSRPSLSSLFSFSTITIVWASNIVVRLFPCFPDPFLCPVRLLS
jgi:hypothetical protein